MFWTVSRRFPDVMWELQKPKEAHKRGGNNKCVCCSREKNRRMTKKKEQRPEEEFLSPFFLDDVQLVVVPQRTGHFLIGHIVSVLLNEITHH